MLCSVLAPAAFEGTSGDHLVEPPLSPGHFVAFFVRLKELQGGKSSFIYSEKPVQSSIPYFTFILTTVNPKYCRMKDHNSLYWRLQGKAYYGVYSWSSSCLERASCPRFLLQAQSRKFSAS